MEQTFTWSHFQESTRSNWLNFRNTKIKLKKKNQNHLTQLTKTKIKVAIEIRIQLMRTKHSKRIKSLKKSKNKIELIFNAYVIN